MVSLEEVSLDCRCAERQNHNYTLKIASIRMIKIRYSAPFSMKEAKRITIYHAATTERGPSLGGYAALFNSTQQHTVQDRKLRIFPPVDAAGGGTYLPKLALGLEREQHCSVKRAGASSGAVNWSGACVQGLPWHRAENLDPQGTEGESCLILDTPGSPVGFPWGRAIDAPSRDVRRAGY